MTYIIRDAKTGEPVSIEAASHNNKPVVITNSNNDSKIYKVLRRVKTLRCDRCPPNRNENRKRAPRRSWKFTFKQSRQFRDRGSL